MTSTFSTEDLEVLRNRTFDEIAVGDHATLQRTLTAVLGGLDMLAFTAGVGERSAVLRERICAALGWLGLELDSDANRANAPTISRAGSRVLIVVEPTNEEWIAASHAVRLLSSETCDVPQP